MLYWLKVALLAVAGLAYILAAVQRWRALDRSPDAPRPVPLLALGLVAHLTVTGLTIALPQHGDLVYAAVGSLLAALAMLLGTRFLAVSTPGLLLMPVGIMALLVAAFAGLDQPDPQAATPGRSLVFFVHVVFMAASLGAVLLAAACAGLYLLASRQLKAASQRALRLPRLPQLGLLCERSLLVALAMHLGGLTSGAVAVGESHHFTLAHPTVIMALVTLSLLAVVVGARALRLWAHRGLSWGAIMVLTAEAATMISLLVVEQHG